MHSHHQQAAYKWDEQTVEIDADVSVSIMKKSGWIGLQISLHWKTLSDKRRVTF